MYSLAVWRYGISKGRRPVFPSDHEDHCQSALLFVLNPLLCFAKVTFTSFALCKNLYYFEDCIS